MKKWISFAAMVMSLIVSVPAVSLGAPEKVASAAGAVATVNINTATQKELESLPGIGKATAENIIAYRTEKGKFKSPEDLVQVKGVGAKTLEKIRDLVSVE